MGTLHQNISHNCLISVIVPAYNCQESLQKCVISILKSIDAGSEVLIVNDGSTDGTLAIAEKISRNDPRIRVISQPNQGVSAARNTGIREAKGKYVAFVDSDDWIDEPYTIFAMLIGSMTSSGADLAIGGYTTSEHKCDLKLQSRIYHRESKNDFEDLILLKSIGKPYGKLVRRDFLLSNDIFFPVGMNHQEDAVFLYKMLAHASIVVTINDDTYHYVLPADGKVYSFKLMNELTGYNEMCRAVDYLINSLDSLASAAQERLEKRKTNMALHVYCAIQHEPIRQNRIDAYKSVIWEGALSQLEIHPIKKWLMCRRLFEIVDMVSF